MLEFDEVNHIYTVGGVVYPGVTTIIRPLYSLEGPSEAVLEYARGRGQAVHKACEIYNLACITEPAVRQLDPMQVFGAPLDPVIQPYFDAWLKFLREKRVTITSAEQRLFHPTMKYAGTWDATGTMEDTGSDDWTFDIKAIAKLHASVGVQLAAYQELRKQNMVIRKDGKLIRMRRAAVQLKPDGKYVFQEYPLYSDWPTFVACYTVHNFRVNNHVGDENGK